MPVTTAEMDDDDIKDLIGEEALDPGTPEPKADEPGKGDSPKDDASGTPADASADEQGDGDDDPRWKTERKAKKALERRIKRMSGEMAELRELYRQTHDTLRALTTAELERRTGSIDASVEAARLRLKKSIDDGDADGQVEAYSALAKAERQAEAARDVVRQSKEARPAAAETKPEPNELAEDWMAERPWFNPAGKDKDSLTVVRASDYVERVLGIAVDDPAHFEELDKIVARDLPHRVAKAGRKSEDRDLPATAGTGRTASGGDALDSKIPAHLRAIADQITKADVALYRQAGLDWNNKEHKQEILEYKYETIQKRAARRG